MHNIMMDGNDSRCRVLTLLAMVGLLWISLDALCSLSTSLPKKQPTVLSPPVPEVVDALPPLVWPPGCGLLPSGNETARRRTVRHRAQLGSLPLSDPFFRELCASPRVRSARGMCFQTTRRVHCLPTFLVVGFTKAGTSVFFQYLSQHTLIRTSPIKVQLIRS